MAQHHITPESFDGRYKLMESEPISLLIVAETYRRMKLDKMHKAEERQRKKSGDLKRQEVRDILKTHGSDPLDVNAFKEKKTIWFGFGRRSVQMPLHKAAKDQNVDMISLLLQFGANPLSKDSSGKSAFDYVNSSTWRVRLQVLHAKVRSEGPLAFT